LTESTRDIKRHIKGINSIKQITKAMELVASARLKRARDRMEKARPYYNTVYDSIMEVLNQVGNIDHPYLKVRDVKKSLYIVVTADRGLAGGFNSNINRLVESEIKDNKENVSLITVGTKARDYFRKREYNILSDLVGMTENPTFGHARSIANIALEAYRQEEVDEVKIVYTEFVSTITQKPKVIKLLPSDSLKADEKREKRAIVEFEPSSDEVLDYLIPKYIQSVVYGALIESSCSQQGARMTAMKNATDNAEEMIDDLQLTYNKARQAAITTEITEIVTGAEALK